MSELEAFVNDNINVVKMGQVFIVQVQNFFGKGENADHFLSKGHKKNARRFTTVSHLRRFTI